jgi:hypothetical protein
LVIFKCNIYGIISILIHEKQWVLRVEELLVLLMEHLFDGLGTE